MDDFELAARLSLLQNLLEHMIANDVTRHPGGGAEALAAFKAAVIASITTNSRFGGPVSDEDKETFNVHARTLGENFFRRTETLRAKIVEARKGRSV